MNILYDRGDKVTTIVFDEEELENAIKTLEFLWALYISANRSQIVLVLDTMKKDEARTETQKYSPGRTTKKAEIIYH